MSGSDKDAKGVIDQDAKSVNDKDAREAGDGTAFANLLKVVRELRLRCPWDREQKLGDTPRHLIEEAYEAADAIARGDAADIADELGDLIAQVLFAAVIAEEAHPFDVGAVLEHARAKLVRRHPHVYGDTKVDSVEQVLDNWDRIKQDERRAKDQDNKNKDGSSRLASTGKALPALMRAEKLGEKARRAGMDWADIRGVLAKVREELDEVEEALARGDQAAAAGELGDMMLALANAPRFIGHNAEETLRRACEKFVSRFDEVDRLATSRGIELKNLSAAEVESLWQEAKRRR
ncbi:MAG TPA: nucleoside triphosphate pyrophosphohydrolase [Candidatus Binataceae bacterium]